MSKINGRNHVLLKQEHQSSYAANSDSFNKRYMQGPKVASNQSLSKAHSAEGKTTNRYYSIEMLQYEANSGAVLGQSKIGSLGQLFQSGRSTSQSGCRKQAAESVKQWHNAKPLKGPIGFYMGIHSASFVIVLVIGKFTSWAPSIAIYRIFEFIAVSGMMLDFWAYQTWNSKRDDAAIKVFYASLVPLFLCLLLANEMRGLVAVLWLISSNLVMLQTGHRQTSIHLITFFVLYQAIHVATSVIDTTSSIECILSTNCYTEFLRPTLMGQIGYTVLGIWITTCFLFLEKLLRLNAITLVERDLYMEALFVANMDLKRQLRLFKNENQTQVEAPLETAINTLKHLDEGKAGTDFSTKIAYMVELLGSDQLLQPDFDSGERDSDLRDWLKDILLTSKDGAAKNAEIEEVTSDVVYLNAELSLSEFDPNLSKYLQGYVSKDFDLFKLDEMSHGHALFHLAEQIFSACEFQKKLKLNPEKFSRWILSIEHDHRHVNPYHNSLHAADVTHMMMYLVSLPKIKAFMTTEDLFACFIAAIIHDYMHPGVNGAFLVNTSNVLALRYNDQTVLEHFHCSSFFEMLSNPDINILEGLSNDQKRSFRELVIAMILATDMTVHFDWIGKFKTKMTSSTGINFENKNDKKLCLNMAMKCADINNISKLTNLSVQWTNLVMEEFFLQGDQEKKLSIAVSAFMNRDTTDIAKCQIVTINLDLGIY